jgi:hypothetical protein
MSQVLFRPKKKRKKNNNNNDGSTLIMPGLSFSFFLSFFFKKNDNT